MSKLISFYRLGVCVVYSLCMCLCLVNPFCLLVSWTGQNRPNGHCVEILIGWGWLACVYDSVYMCGLIQLANYCPVQKRTAVTPLSLSCHVVPTTRQTALFSHWESLLQWTHTYTVKSAHATSNPPESTFLHTYMLIYTHIQSDTAECYTLLYFPSTNSGLFSSQLTRQQLKLNNSYPSAQDTFLTTACWKATDVFYASLIIYTNNTTVEYFNLFVYCNEACD